jgi:thymidylate synthase (FAD)
VTALYFRSDVTVKLVQAMASDEAVTMAARVSTGATHTSPEKDKGLINYLMRDRHGSPFEHNAFTFYIEAPIFVFREFMRHRIASYNEESGRYKELEPVFYVPAPERKLIQVGKVGAYEFVEGSNEQFVVTSDSIKDSCVFAYEKYTDMLNAGVAREVARAVLPVNTYSSMFVTMNARSLMNFLSLRTTREGTHFPSFPQREIEMVAEQMECFFAEKMPITYETFNKNGRVAP